MYTLSKRLALLVCSLFIASPLWASFANAKEPLPVVATFSILGDMVKQVGGERVQVELLVGSDGDAHIFQPTPRHAQLVAKAELLFANGLGFEGWMDRLIEASGFAGTLVPLTEGVKAISAEGGHHHGHGHDDGHNKDHDDGPVPDPHAWHSLENAKIYAANAAAALTAADPEGAAYYQEGLTRYLAEINELESDLFNQLLALPPGAHRVVTSHDAFGYFADAYGVEFLAPLGMSTESEASAKDVAQLIRQIKADKVAAIFLETTTNPRLIQQIEQETDAQIGGTLYTGALSGPDGPAPTYLDMMRHNIATVMAVLK